MLGRFSRMLRGAYLTAMGLKFPVKVDELSLSLILNSTIIDDTTLLINGTPYRYIIIYVYNYSKSINRIQ